MRASNSFCCLGAARARVEHASTRAVLCYIELELQVAVAPLHAASLRDSLRQRVHEAHQRHADDPPRRTGM